MKMKHRSCPTCGHPVGLRRFLLKAKVWAEWNCPNCDTLLTFRTTRRLILSVTFPIVILVTWFIFQNTDNAVLWVASICIFLAIPIFLLDGVTKSDKHA